MFGKKTILGAFLALVTAGFALPAHAQGFCGGVTGNALCGAGIGGGLGAALGGNKGAKTGAIIGGVIGLGSGLQQQPPPPVYRQPVYTPPPPPPPVYRQPVYAPPPPPPPRYTYRQAYQPAYSSELVYEIQAGLLQLGYNPGPADGLYGGGTRAAIEAYQGDNGLLVDGEPTDQLFAHMQQYLE